MRNTIQIRLETETAHRLQKHKGLCKNIHGHSYRWTIVVGANAVDKNSMIMDFSVLKEEVKKVVNRYDHSIVLGVGDPLIERLIGWRMLLVDGEPTAENMAKIVAQEIAIELQAYPFIKLLCVRVRETTNNEASYYLEEGYTLIDED